ncbi:MAG: hypothetical protein GY913_07685 [Proteobacteria bacterium]|nr:hypothetical protein [Pseudomonadota bacterium]MCP4916792.1 hypothetical protein [Pseudomonadota bacterium]
MEAMVVGVSVVLGLVWVVWRHKRRLARIEEARGQLSGSPEADLVNQLISLGRSSARAEDGGYTIDGSAVRSGRAAAQTAARST